MRVTLILLAVVCVVLGAFAARLAWRERMLIRNVEALRAQALAADSAAADRDSTRVVLLSVDGDSVRVWQRRVMQVRQQADSLDRAIGLERAARYRVEAAVQELTAQVAARDSSAAAVDDSLRRGEFVVDDPPYHVVASVTLPPAPGDGQMMVRVRLDTALIDARVGCGRGAAGSTDGVNPATLTLVGPSWVGVRVVRVEQEARVCSPDVPAQRSTERRFGWVRQRLGLTVGYGVTVGEHGRLALQPVAALGIRVGW